ncbi:MAG: M20 family metallopeptidase [Chitinophagaceae bacterium]|nr:M20 family metallopeptidase [Chitinophagaceae bacterium]
MSLNDIKELSLSLAGETIAMRRHLHANPEVSFQEQETSAFIKAELDKLNIPWQSMANTGVVGIIKGNLPGGRTIALRADMDALPILEQNQVDYASSRAGVMHACGHDAHTSSLLTAAKILQHLRDRFAGTIKLIFQPGEEVLPGGASLMIKDGVLDNPRPEIILGQHVDPRLPAGTVAMRGGAFMASMDQLRFTVKGRGGHGAQPHTVIDPVYTASQLVISLQQIVSRKANPASPTVLSIGRFIAEGAVNIIPDEVKMEGTLRCFDEEWRKEAHEWIRQTAAAVAASTGATCDVDITVGYPVLNNNHEIANRVQAAASEFLGNSNVTEAAIWTAAEDFASYSQQIPACFYLLGVGNKEKGISSGLHTPQFNLDEDVLSFSPGLMAWMAISMIEEQP